MVAWRACIDDKDVVEGCGSSRTSDESSEGRLSIISDDGDRARGDVSGWVSVVRSRA